MVKEGEGGVKVGKQSSLQQATGQGKETEGIKYPYPAPHVLAFMEDEFGSLDEMRTAPTRHAYHFSLMLIACLELQKEKNLKKMIALSKAERRVFAAEVLERKKIVTQEILGDRGKAAMEVFSNALGARVKSK